MKTTRTLLLLMALLLALMPVLAQAAPSPTNPDIQETEVVDVVPVDETEPVVPPVITIIPDPEPVAELQEELQTVYHLTIYYVYIDGTTAAETYEAVLQEGTDYSVTSPLIENYTATIPIVSGTMPGRNVVVTVVYFSEEANQDSPVFALSLMTNLFSMEDYEVPLGLGFSMSNVGICFE